MEAQEDIEESSNALVSFDIEPLHRLLELEMGPRLQQEHRPGCPLLDQRQSH